HKVAQAAEREKRVQLVKQVVLTSPTRTMIETAPGVLKLADRVQRDMLRVQTGPFAGRWQELWAGRIGEADPDFIKLRGDITLLPACQRYGVGGRVFEADHLLTADEQRRLLAQVQAGRFSAPSSTTTTATTTLPRLPVLGNAADLAQVAGGLGGGAAGLAFGGP